MLDEDLVPLEEGMRILPEESWTYQRAALESSSYMKLNRVMRWITGNIGYHHIHHLNVRIPFYRLPEARTFDAWRAKAPEGFCLALKFSLQGISLFGAWCIVKYAFILWGGDGKASGFHCSLL